MSSCVWGGDTHVKRPGRYGLIEDARVVSSIQNKKNNLLICKLLVRPSAYTPPPTRFTASLLLLHYVSHASSPATVLLSSTTWFLRCTQPMHSHFSPLQRSDLRVHGHWARGMHLSIEDGSSETLRSQAYEGKQSAEAVWKECPTISLGSEMWSKSKTWLYTFGVFLPTPGVSLIRTNVTLRRGISE